MLLESLPLLAMLWPTRPYSLIASSRQNCQQATPGKSLQGQGLQQRASGRDLTLQSCRESAKFKVLSVDAQLGPDQ